MISEYSLRLREAATSEKHRVLQQFRHDLRLSLRGLRRVEQWVRVTDWAFYVSIPLAVVGVLCGIPLSDLLVIPVTAFAKAACYTTSRQAEWVMFGRDRFLK